MCLVILLWMDSILLFLLVVPYEVVMTTGDVREAGTDARIFITLYGSLGATIPVEMAKKGERFERACTDVIKVKHFYTFCCQSNLFIKQLLVC